MKILFEEKYLSLFLVILFLFFWGDIIIWVGLTCVSYYFFAMVEEDETRRFFISLIVGSIQNFFLCFSIFFILVFVYCMSIKKVQDDDTE